MDPTMIMFRELVGELTITKNIETLKNYKQQFEEEIMRIGKENKLMEKYLIVCDAIGKISK